MKNGSIAWSQNGHFSKPKWPFEEMLQILQIVENSTLFYKLFDTPESPGDVFIWKSEFTIGFGIVREI